MKARWRLDNWGRLEVCVSYPECNCESHYIYEKNKRRNLKEEGNK